MTRLLVVWCPDWPVTAACAEAGVGTRAPAAVFRANLVTACNAAARQYGVRRGMRRRDAQGRCPEIAVLADDPDRDARAFEPVLGTLEALRPGVATVRPGLAALPVPAVYYGGEEPAAAVIAEALVGAGVRECRFGVADDLFTAEQAARGAARQECVVVPTSGSPTFLRDLPVEVLEDDEESAEMVDLLRRLGVRTLGDLAALPERDVHQRFGGHGLRIHRVARGADPGKPELREPPPDLVCEVGFEPPLETVEAVCFSLRRTADRFVEQVAARQLVCTRVRVEVECDGPGGGSVGTMFAERSWAHVRWFGATDIVDRVRWQLGATRSGAPVATVRLVPETVEPGFGEGLWGGAEELVDRQVAKVRALLGYDAVAVPVLQGGRSPADRQSLVPWGDRPTGLRPRGLPWPGGVPGPAPAVVLCEPWPAVVVDAGGAVATVSDRGVMSGEPARFRPQESEDWQPVAAWAGPWPVDELWWEETQRRVARFQVVGADGRAWLMTCSMTGGDGRWWTEASYD